MELGFLGSGVGLLRCQLSLGSEPVGLDRAGRLSSTDMAGSGVAIRLHEFRECPDASQTSWCPRQGRDVLGFYPGQLGRVHQVHSGVYRLPVPQSRDPPPGYDIRTLRALSDSPRSAVEDRRPPLTTYQQHFGGLGRDLRR